MSVAQPRDTAVVPPIARFVRRHGWRYLFLLPMLVLFAAFTVWPLIASIAYSLYDWSGFGPIEDFVGLANFGEAFGDPLVWNAFKNTAIFIGFAIVVQMPLALLLAIWLNNKFLRGRSVYRVLLFLPVVTTTAVVGVVFTAILNPSGGPVSALTFRLGISEVPIEFLSSERLALPTLLLIDMWKGIGITIIYWLAALQTIPEELYEAARVDGADRRRILAHITIPLLVPLGVVILLLTVVTSMNVFDLVQVTTAGGPNGATDIVQTYVYRYAFNTDGTPRFGYAAAVGLLFGITVMLVTVAGRMLGRRRRRPEPPVQEGPR